jgi:cytochrome P450
VRRLLERLLPGRPAPAPEPEPAPGPLDLLDPAFVRDPYPIYARLRAADPMHRTRSGGFLLTRHADIVSALAHPALGNAPSRHSVVHARNRDRYVSADVAANILPFLDRPEHVRPRRLIASAFRAQMKAQPPQVETVARELLAPCLREGRMEAIGDFGTPLSVEVISRFMGLPDGDRARLTHWSNHFFYLFAPMPSDEALRRTDEALAEFRAYFAALAAERRARPGEDFVSRLIAAEEEGERLSEAQIVDTCLLVFSDGVENVDAGIANTLLALSRHPAEMRRLRAAPDLVPAAVQEGLRHDSPAQMIGRVAREDIELGGCRIKRDTPVFLALGAANRDPGIFAEPDRFDLGRDASALLSFGKGRHSCIGAPLVKLQMEGALRAIFEATSDILIDESALAWTARAGHRWLEALPVKLAPR